MELVLLGLSASLFLWIAGNITLWCISHAAKITRSVAFVRVDGHWDTKDWGQVLNELNGAKPHWDTSAGTVTTKLALVSDISADGTIAQQRIILRVRYPAVWVQLGGILPHIRKPRDIIEHAFGLLEKMPGMRRDNNTSLPNGLVAIRTKSARPNEASSVLLSVSRKGATIVFWLNGKTNAQFIVLCHPSQVDNIVGKIREVGQDVRTESGRRTHSMLNGWNDRPISEDAVPLSAITALEPAVPPASGARIGIVPKTNQLVRLTHTHSLIVTGLTPAERQTAKNLAINLAARYARSGEVVVLVLTCTDLGLRGSKSAWLGDVWPPKSVSDDIAASVCTASAGTVITAHTLRTGYDAIVGITELITALAAQGHHNDPRVRARIIIPEIPDTAATITDVATQRPGRLSSSLVQTGDLQAAILRLMSETGILFTSVLSHADWATRLAQQTSIWPQIVGKVGQILWLTKPSEFDSTPVLDKGAEWWKMLPSDRSNRLAVLLPHGLSARTDPVRVYMDENLPTEPDLAPMTIARSASTVTATPAAPSTPTPEPSPATATTTAAPTLVGIAGINPDDIVVDDEDALGQNPQPQPAPTAPQPITLVVPVVVPPEDDLDIEEAFS